MNNYVINIIITYDEIKALSKSSDEILVLK